MRRVWQILFAAAAVWIAALTQRGAALAVDEIEFFRATRWVGEGAVPFRDFWEHHTPLQWLLFAPVARLFANGPGAGAVVTLRWAQLALWVAALVLLTKIVRRRGLDPWPALALLLVSASFVGKALEYRVDVPGNLAFLAAVALIGSREARRPAWIAFGAFMSAAVLANMRLAPLVIVTAIAALFWRGGEGRWRWNGRALWMFVGVAAVAAAFLGYLAATAALQPFLDAVIGYNTTSARLLEVHTFWDAFLTPLWTLDPGGIAYWLAAIAGGVLAVRRRREGGPLQFFLLLAIAAVVTIALMKVQYDYHFQICYLLLFPLVASALAALTRPLWRGVAAAVAAVALLVSLLQILPAFGSEMEYQDRVMTGADRVTLPGERVFDGAGFALRRKPAYRYWFLTTGVRMMAARRLIEPYGLGDLAADPPAAIVADYRFRLYLETFPRVAEYTTRHYVPLYRNLWVPGMTIVAGPSPGRVAWTAPRAGQYDIWASEALVRHPWLTHPLAYASIRGPLAARYAIPLAKLPPAPPDQLQWIVDGARQFPGTRDLILRKGSRVELVATVTVPTGILLVPHGMDTLCLGPEGDFDF
jgi:hypothetical protein